jgi:hypothetical protein
MFLLTPISDKPDLSADEILKTLIGNGWFVFGDKNPHREKLKPGDQICFYMKGRGVVAKASVASVPKKQRLPFPFPHWNSENFPWSFRLVNGELFFDSPVILNERMRTQLESFRGKDLKRNWAWFVQSTRIVSEQEFVILTTRAKQLDGPQERAK